MMTFTGKTKQLAENRFLWGHLWRETSPGDVEKVRLSSWRNRVLEMDSERAVAATVKNFFEGREVQQKQGLL